MDPERASIFRPDAVRRHARAQDRAVLLRLAPPRPGPGGWLLAGLAALACLLAGVGLYLGGG